MLNSPPCIICADSFIVAMKHILPNVQFDLNYNEIYTDIKPLFVGKVRVPDIQCPECSELFLSANVQGFYDHWRAMQVSSTLLGYVSRLYLFTPATRVLILSFNVTTASRPHPISTVLPYT
jgi:hypothetical protein